MESSSNNNQYKQRQQSLIIQNFVCERLVMRMKENGLVVHHIKEIHIDFINTVNQRGYKESELGAMLNSLQLFMDSSYRYSDIDMMIVLSLGLSTNSNDQHISRLKKKRHCYVQSWCVPPDILAKLRDLWVQNGINNTPTSRQLALNKTFNTREYGVFSSLRRALQEIAGGQIVIDDCKEYIVDTENAVDYDLQEQLLIAFFNLQSTVNSQPGGIVSRYNPGLDCFNNYRSLPITQEFFKAFMDRSTPVPHECHSKIQNWAAMVNVSYESYLKNAVALPLPAQYLTYLYKQALPSRTVNTHTVIALVSSDIPKNKFYNNGIDFLDPNSASKSPSSSLTIDCLSRLAAWQQGEPNWSFQDMRTFFPFVDVLPWISPENHCCPVDEGMQQLNYYMRTVNPIVTVTISSIATRCAFSNFIHANASIPKRFIQDVVGIPKLVYIQDHTKLTHDSVLDLPFDTGYLTLVVPHVHPGNDLYTDQNPQGIRSLIDVTWQITLHIAQLAIVVAMSATDLKSREMCLHQLYERCCVDSQALDPVLETLYKRLDEAKKKWQQVQSSKDYQGKSAAMPTTLDYYANGIENTRIHKNRIALGAPQSPDRLIQAKFLWKLNLPDLHLNLDRSQPDEWFKWILNVGEGKSFFASVLRHRSVADRHPAAPTLQRFRPEGAMPDDYSWMRNSDLVRQAGIKSAAIMRQNLPSQFFSPEQQKQHRVSGLQKQGKCVAHSTVENTLAFVQKKGDVLVYWNFGNVDHKFQFFVNELKHNINGGRVQCKVNFIEEGIQFTMVHDSSITGIYSKGRITIHSSSNLIMQLWCSERSRLTGTEQNFFD